MDALWLVRIITHSRSLRKKLHAVPRRLATAMEPEFRRSDTLLDVNHAKHWEQKMSSFSFYRNTGVFKLCGWRNGMIYFARRCERCTFVTSERVFDNLLPTWLTYVWYIYVYTWACSWMRKSEKEREPEKERGHMGKVRQIRIVLLESVSKGCVDLDYYR